MLRKVVVPSFRLFAFMQPFKVQGFLLSSLLLLWTVLSLHAHGASTDSTSNSTSQKADSSLFKKENSFEGSWSALIRGRDIEDDFNHTTLGLLRLNIQLQYKFNNQASLLLSPVLTSISGHSQVDNTSSSSNNPIQVNTAKLNYTPFSSLSISGGVLNTRDVHTALLVEERGFPGFRISYGTPERKGMNFLSYAESTVVESQSLTTNTRDKEATPLLHAFGLGLRSNSDLFTFSLRGSAYSFKDLPNSVATDSGFFGNSVRPVNATESQFIYNYYGFETEFFIKYQIHSRFTPSLLALAISNENAPSGLNNGYLIEAAVDSAIHSKLSIIPSYQYFRIEPDASVASLMDSRLNTNRVGYRYILKADFFHQFRIFAGAGERTSIYTSSTQPRETLYELGMETMNAPF